MADVKTPPKPTYGNFLTTGTRIMLHLNWQWDGSKVGGGIWYQIEGTVDFADANFLVLIPKAGGSPMVFPNTGYNYAQMIPQ